MKLESNVNCSQCVSKDVCKYKVSMQNALPVIEKQCENIGSIAVLSLRCDHYHPDSAIKGEVTNDESFDEILVPSNSRSYSTSKHLSESLLDN